MIDHDLQRAVPLEYFLEQLTETLGVDAADDLACISDLSQLPPYLIQMLFMQFNHAPWLLINIDRGEYLR